MITGDDPRLSFIIRRVLSNEHAVLDLGREKDGKKSYKFAPAALTSSDLSIGTNCTHFKSLDTIPLGELVHTT
jgi:hypothetical protein